MHLRLDIMVYRVCKAQTPVMATTSALGIYICVCVYFLCIYLVFELALFNVYASFFSSFCCLYSGCLRPSHIVHCSSFFLRLCFSVFVLRLRLTVSFNANCAVVNVSQWNKIGLVRHLDHEGSCIVLSRTNNTKPCYSQYDFRDSRL